MRFIRCKFCVLVWSLAFVAIGLVWLSEVSSQPIELLKVISSPDSATKEAAADKIDFLIGEERLIRWGVVEIDVQTILKYDDDVLRSTSVDAITLTPFQDYRLHAVKTNYRTAGGYHAVWEGSLQSDNLFGGGRIFIRVMTDCEAPQDYCLTVHAYPHSGLFDNLFYSRQLGIFETRLPGVYVVWEVRRNNISYWWTNRNTPPYA